MFKLKISILLFILFCFSNTNAFAACSNVISACNSEHGDSNTSCYYVELSENNGFGDGSCEYPASSLTDIHEIIESSIATDNKIDKNIKISRYLH